MLLTRVKNSLAYRLPFIYKQLLHFKKPVMVNKPKGNVHLLMMTGKAHLAMLKLCVISIAKNWDTLPVLIVTSDGTITTEKIEHKLRFWKGKLVVESWQKSREYHISRGRDALARYADAHPFGKKMAIILYHAENHPVVWIDSDILFFKDFTSHIPQTKSGFACGGAEDCVAGYDHILAKKLDSGLYDRTPFNAGLLYVSGVNIYEDFKLEDIINDVHPDYDFCTEQTLFAHVSDSSLGILWPRTVIANHYHDNLQLKPAHAEEIVGRHYVSNVRHLFWRDAFFYL